MKKILKSLSKNSLLHGAYVAAITPIAANGISMLESGSFNPIGLKATLITGLSAGVIYILKNAIIGSSEKVK